MDESVVQPCVHVLECVCDNRMSWGDDAVECLEVCGGDKCRRVNAKTAKIANDKAF